MNNSNSTSKVKQGGDERATKTVHSVRLGVSEEANAVSPMKWNWNAAIVLFAHGARDPEWAQPFFTIRDQVAQQFPKVPVRVAFLEIMHPPLQVAIAELAAQGTDHITLIPLFMARGGHLKEDLPRLLTDIYQHHPGIRFHTAPAIGEVDAVLQCIAQWVGAQYLSAQ